MIETTEDSLGLVSAEDHSRDGQDPDAPQNRRLSHDRFLWVLAAIADGKELSEMSEADVRRYCGHQRRK